MKRSSPKKSCFTVLPAVLHVFPHGAAVSYTHLDVYKRQAVEEALEKRYEVIKIDTGVELSLIHI